MFQKEKCPNVGQIALIALSFQIWPVIQAIWRWPQTFLQHSSWHTKYMKYEKWNLWRIFWFKILQGSKIYVGWHFDMTWYVRSLPLTQWEAMNKEVSLIRNGLRQVSCFCGPNLSQSDMAPDKVTLTVSFFPFTFHPHYCQKHYRDSWGKLSVLNAFREKYGKQGRNCGEQNFRTDMQKA